MKPIFDATEHHPVSKEAYFGLFLDIAVSSLRVRSGWQERNYSHADLCALLRLIQPRPCSAGVQNKAEGYILHFSIGCPLCVRSEERHTADAFSSVLIGCVIMP